MDCVWSLEQDTLLVADESADALFAEAWDLLDLLKSASAAPQMGRFPGHTGRFLYLFQGSGVFRLSSSDKTMTSKMYSTPKRE